MIPDPRLADGWFTARKAELAAMDGDALLRAATVHAWNEHRQAVLAESYRTGSDHLLRELRRPLARAWELLDWRRKTVPMDALRYAIDLEYAADRDALAARQAAGAPS